ncbi:MAG: phage holin family protein [Flavobacteriaceae bacterium]|nr:phage holin family protein [Flavobacteriaceae bacterium]MCB0706099.1 phage holin family protein [Saprospiraceae bacterium]
MNSTDEIFEQAAESVEYVKHYISTQRDLMKLDFAERSARLISGLVLGFSFAIIGLLVIGFISVAFALLIGQWLGSVPLGFVSISGIYLLLGLIVFWFRKVLLVEPVLSKVIQQFFD